jgi:hypothetical protein
MRPAAAFLFLAVTCTLGCKSITEIARFHHSPTGAFADQPIAKADDPLLFSGAINDVPQTEAPAAAKTPEVNPPPPAENPKRAAIVVSELPRSTGGGVGSALSRKAVPQLQPPTKSLSGAGDTLTKQTVKQVNRPLTTQVNRSEPELRAATPSSGTDSTPDPASQGYSKEAWYAIGTICGALFTSILAPLLVDFIRHCVGLGPFAHHHRCQDSP